uniref:Uncharacterized protein n=1 Tax=Glossina pallidipes TaxID=7398 RepID=A0A1B0ABQ4_GLOPL
MYFLLYARRSPLQRAKKSFVVLSLKEVSLKKDEEDAKDADAVAVAVAVGLQFKVSCLVNWSHTFEIIHWKSCFNGSANIFYYYVERNQRDLFMGVKVFDGILMILCIRIKLSNRISVVLSTAMMRQQQNDVDLHSSANPEGPNLCLIIFVLFVSMLTSLLFVVNMSYIHLALTSIS